MRGETGPNLGGVRACSPAATAAFALNDNECNPGGCIYGLPLQTSNWPLLRSLLRHGCSPSDVVYGLDHGLVLQSMHLTVGHRPSPPLLRPSRPVVVVAYQ